MSFILRKTNRFLMNNRRNLPIISGYYEQKRKISFIDSFL